jgi:hypothetical protein
MKNLFTFLFLVAIATLIISCSESTSTEDVISYSTTLNSANETNVPKTKGTGTFTASYTKSTKFLKYTVTWNLEGDTINMGHIHKGAPGTDGPVFVAFAKIGKTKTGSYTDSTTFTALQDSLFRSSERFYVNLHTVNDGAGIIRGQIK